MIGKEIFIFAGSAAPATYLGLQKYFFSQGLIYKLVPVQAVQNRDPNSLGEMDKEVAYRNLMENYQYGNIEKEGVLVDYYTRRGINNYRIQFSVLADAYASEYENAQRKLDFIYQVDKDSTSAEIDKLKALQVETKEKVVTLLNKSLEVMPPHQVPYGRIMPYYIKEYYSVGAVEEAEKLAIDVLDVFEEELDYYLHVDAEFSGSMLEEASSIYRGIFTIFQTVSIVHKTTNEELSTRLENDVQQYMEAFEAKKKEYREVNRLGTYNATIGAFINQITSRIPQP